MSPTLDIQSIDWQKVNNLVPVIVQDVHTLRVLMLGYANQEALQKTIETGLVTFFSRTKQRLWQKGETSGHVLRVHDIKLDCDKDTILILAEPHGETCHLGSQTCFGESETPNLSVLADLAATIHQRHTAPDPTSYTAQLFAEGITRIAQKVGEEGVETALAAATHSPDLASEAADLVYHLLVLLEASDQSWQDVLTILHKRAHKKSAQ